MISERQKEVWNAATGMLARREHSRQELIRKLTSRDYEVALIDDVLDQLVKSGYQSDERFTGHYIRFRSGKGYGPSRIRMELIEKGVDETIIQQGLDNADIDWLELAESVRGKKFKGQVADSWEERGRQKKFLDYRGFTCEQIQHCINGDEFD